MSTTTLGVDVFKIDLLKLLKFKARVIKSLFWKFSQQVRGMATLKMISLRLKSVKNIQKITQSMKMVSAAKYTKAERELKVARPYGVGAQEFYKKAEVKGNNENNLNQYLKNNNFHLLTSR